MYVPMYMYVLYYYCYSYGIGISSSCYKPQRQWRKDRSPLGSGCWQCISYWNAGTCMFPYFICLPTFVLLCLPRFITFVVSLDNIVTDVNSIKNGMNLTRNEYETHQHPVLEGFIESSQEKVTKVRNTVLHWPGTILVI